ncbi:MAG: aldo/keto reductase [Chromatiales bacterium]
MTRPPRRSDAPVETLRRALGGTGLHVFPVGLGAMPLSIEGRPDTVQAFEVVKAFIDGGGDFIDTANAYCLDDQDIGHNERLLADCLTRLGVRERVVVATKGGLTRPQGRWEVDGHPAWIRASCEQSLRDLNTDCIALYQLHAIDPNVPLLETLGELVRLQQEGKIRHIGLSNVHAEQLELALRHATIASVQNRCNPVEQRDFRSGLVDLCRARAVAYVPHSPVGGHHNHVRMSAHPVLLRLAARHETSTYCIMLAWLFAKGEHIVPIPGASRVTSISDSLRAATIQLAAEDVKAVDGLAG